MQLVYQGQSYSAEIGAAERLQLVSIYRVPADYQGGLFVVATPIGDLEEVPASLGSQTVLLLRGTQAPGEAMQVDYQAEGVSLG